MEKKMLRSPKRSQSSRFSRSVKATPERESVRCPFFEDIAYWPSAMHMAHGS